MPIPRCPCFATLALLTGLLQGCGSDTQNGGPTGPTGSFTVTASSPVSLPVGASRNATLTIVRTNFTGSVTLAVENLPTGVTATFNPQPVPGDAATLTLAANSGATPGAYAALVRASAAGHPDATAPLTVSISAVPAASHSYKSVIAGAGTTCALNTSGAAYCWGSNSIGQLGTGSSANISTMPVAVAGGLTFAQLAISVTGRSVCGIQSGGKAYCWGNNDRGQLGDGTTTSRNTPTPVAGGLSFLSISVGRLHACGVTVAFAAYCWGLNAFGAFGDGTTTAHPTPSPAAPGLTFKSISAADDYTCGLTPAGVAYCWGLGGSGQLGSGGVPPMFTLAPVQVAANLTFTALVAGSFDACGLTAAGHAYCWGLNLFGEVGDSSTIQRTAPVAVAGGHQFTSLSAGFEHFCGVATGGIAYCWGYNDSGVLGDGTFANRSVPTAILAPQSGPLKMQTMGVGYTHACGVTEITGSTNEIYCWGTNSTGELGDGTLTPSAGPFLVVWP